ncbi:variant sh3 domain containing protein [Acanthamoeba castellanii str. Neff]|uniref:Variant sh3 domain containing protein n=1 Tax=Acanthamoeba castellanii (strain ATCC 30010 / Neff) TaxID=1257118 RepID=L8GR09_ACACF|nr:variant sh3 domain containing protein [Acanthamoeba castellanii str. Neff]ELR15073.1 variant sh3 domain containing protein [Acanthamoeba castellanii str. Neff]
MLAFAKAKYAFTGMDTGDLRFDKDEVFLVTKKEGAWWWGMKEGESGETSEESNTRRVRIMEPSSTDQGRFPKNYVIEITQDEYLKLKKEQEKTRHERKLEDADRRKKQEEVWTQKMEQIRAEEEARRRQERTQLKLQKVFGSEGDILLLSPRLQKEARLDALVSPRQREKKNERDKEAETQREKSGDGDKNENDHDGKREKSNKSSKTSSGDNRELKSSGEKRSKAFSVVREERAHSADDSSRADLLLVGAGRHHPSPLATPSRSCGDIGSGVDDQSTGGSGGITRKWLKKKKSLPRSLDKVASDYKEQRRQQEETAELAAGAAATTTITPITPTTSDEMTSAGGGDAASASESASAEVDEWESGEWDGASTTRRRQVSASTAFMNDMNYLAPELAMRAEEARKKRMRGRNAVSLDRA